MSTFHLHLEITVAQETELYQSQYGKIKAQGQCVRASVCKDIKETKVRSQSTGWNCQKKGYYQGQKAKTKQVDRVFKPNVRDKLLPPLCWPAAVILFAETKPVALSTE